MSVERGDTVIARDVNGKATAQKNKNAGRDPRQEIARQDDNSDQNTVHVAISLSVRTSWLPDSTVPHRFINTWTPGAARDMSEVGR